MDFSLPRDRGINVIANVKSCNVFPKRWRDEGDGERG
jgi:hypothetical protein